MIFADEANTIHDVGHRAFIGGNDEFWNSISKLQFEFLVSQGLKPSDTFIDVACGSLRAGTRLIPYLDPGNYIGVDKHIELVIYGVAKELGVDTFNQRRPRFVISDRFEFDRVSSAPTFGIAQSLFTHLTVEHIVLCLTRLRAIVAPGCRFFATYHEARTETDNPDLSHSLIDFQFTRQQMEEFGREANWTPRYIGSWNHPRHQTMVEYRAF